jgi:hypothetical protein
MINQEIMHNEIPVIITIILIFGLGTYHAVYAEKNGNTRYNSSDSTTTITIPLPFNSHVADQANDEKIYSIYNLPFP